MGDTSQPRENIRRFEHSGTRPIQTLQTIPQAIVFHNKIGSALKEQRLRYLMQYWVAKVANIPKIKVLTPWQDSARCCAIANIAVDGYTPAELAETLFKQYKIFTVAIQHPIVNGIRVTPHLSTKLEDLDALVNAIRKITQG